MGEALYLGRVHLAVDVYALCFFGENHGAVEVLRGDARDAYAGGLDGEYLVDALIGEAPAEFLAHLVDERNVHLVVEEAVHLEDVSLLDNAVFSDSVLKKLHFSLPLR